MKLMPLLCALLLASSTMQAGAEGLPVEAQQMLDDLGTSDVQQRNNDKWLKCIFGGSKKITVSPLEGATIFSGEYNNCRERGSSRDGYFEVIVKDGILAGQSAKRSVNGELFEVVQEGDVVKAKHLINNKADVNYTESVPTTDGGVIEGWTPLMSAVIKGNAKLVKLLVKSGAWVNYMNSRAITALWLAAVNGNLETVKTLVINGAYVNNKNIDDVTPLMNSAMYGHLNVVKYLLGSNADMNFVHKDGDSALMLALANGHNDIARLLIESGANINIKNKFGVTALTIAVVEDNEEMVKELVEKKANLQVKTDGGKTALDIAITKGNKNIIMMLK